jgi:hypothetical protein
MASAEDNSLKSGAGSLSGPARLCMPDDPAEAKAWLEARLLEGRDEDADVTMSSEEWSHLWEEALMMARRRAS